MTLSHSTSSTRLLERPEGRIAYDIIGGSGPLLVAVPGMGDTRASYRILAPALADAGYRVATMDLRGHGDSDTTFSAFGARATGTDVLALVDHLAPTGPVVLLGNSMGAGSVVWAAAERPDVVTGLVLIGPVVRGGLSAVLQLVVDALLLRPWGPTFWVSYRRRLMKGGRPADLAADEARLRASLARPGAWRAFRRTTHSSPATIEPRLRDVRARTLVVMGTADPDFKDASGEAREVADLLHGTALLVDGAGHYPHVERPAEVTPAVLEFLAAVAPVRAKGAVQGA